MPYVYVEPEVFINHNGVDIFHAYRDGTNEPWTYWFTTNPATADNSHGHGLGGWFDVRRLTGKWSDTPSVAAWDEWWRCRFMHESEALDALIKEAIDDGRLPNS